MKTGIWSIIGAICVVVGLIIAVVAVIIDVDASEEYERTEAGSKGKEKRQVADERMLSDNLSWLAMILCVVGIGFIIIGSFRPSSKVECE